MTDLLTDEELDLAIDAAHRQWLRLVRVRARRRYSKTIAAHPEINQRKYTDETRKRMSNAATGRKRSDATKAKISAGIMAHHARRRARNDLEA